MGARKKRKKRERLKAEKAEKRKKFFKKNGLIFGIPSVVLGTTIGVYSLTKNNNSFLPVVEPAELERKLEDAVEIPMDIGFKQAVNKSELRQEYLEQLLEDEAQTSEGWECFNGFIYDPGFKQFKKRIGDMPHGYGIDLTAVAATYSDRPFKKSDCYISELGFDTKVVMKENEFKSLLDNEAYHAHRMLTGQLVLSKKGVTEKELDKILKNADKELIYKSEELLSFAHQYRQIQDGKRKVRQRFVNNTFRGMLELYELFENISQEKSYNGKYAQVILNTCPKIEKVKK